MARGRKHTPKKAYILQIVRGVLVMILVGGIGYGIWHVTRLPSLTINEIEVTDGDTIAASVISSEVEMELGGTYLALIPRTFSFLFPKAAIESAVKAVPRVKDVTLTKPNRTTLAVSFTEYHPFALWCDEEQAHCLFIDETGYAFTDAPDLTGGSLLRFVVEDAPLLLRETTLTHEQLVVATAFSEQLMEEFGFVAEEFYYLQNGDVYVSLAGGAELRIRADESIEETFSNLETVLGSEEFLHLRPTNFQYIDLRFGNKVFVNEEIAVPEVSTSTATSS